jgi:8-oxo-dGTP diphosphatase
MSRLKSRVKNSRSTLSRLPRKQPGRRNKSETNLDQTNSGGAFLPPSSLVEAFMAFDALTCPNCGKAVKSYRNPLPTVDIIIETDAGIILIERKNKPLGWALPGGFVDYGETLEEAARREAREETSLEIDSLELLGCYSDPKRDTRCHTITTVFIAHGEGVPQAADDAINLGIFTVNSLPSPLCFDHARILSDYASIRRG